MMLRRGDCPADLWVQLHLEAAEERARGWRGRLWTGTGWRWARPQVDWGAGTRGAPEANLERPAEASILGPADALSCDPVLF